MKVGAIIPSAGEGRRLGGVPKVFLPLGDKPLIFYTLFPFLQLPSIDQIIVPVRRENLQLARSLLAELPVEVIEGGDVRQETVRLALERLKPSIELVVIHDGARPFLSLRLLEACLEAGEKFGAVVPVLPIYDTIKKGDEWVKETLSREGLFTVQTPQVFKAELIKEAHRKAKEEGFLATDDASLVERLGVKVKMIKGEKQNIKITDPEDLVMAEKLYCSKKELRTGIGIDFHQLVEGRKLYLGGVEIEHEKGLLGHSDGDVLLHALADSILGAIGLGDIGVHFPPTDPRWKDVRSTHLLSLVLDMARKEGWAIENVDCTLLAEEPRIAPYREQMKNVIANCLGIEREKVNIKATTTEKMGFIGRKEGICAICNVLCYKFSKPL
ncbi:bifunctional 2-C-methyl-D-erythritol 4-phosphate cytidylyltransferase/2-C-methyl-D-erythritol 2,4-cyclodiphosphate synthase [bacterium]|nr:bifunctional 2-C-methyl-D-erythritol 4-phosphate cytidylyltransferase/2-C-methyl-D-erythritol 2,4-cyclodiphosphate synthase [bacterium]